MRLMTPEDIDYIALGAAILGTGGGGSPYIGKLIAQEAIREHGPVELIDPEEVPDGATAALVAMMGAPTVLVEKPPRGDELARAAIVLQRHTGRRIEYAVCAEAGGVNSTTPFVVAATLGIPLVDADGMGRAFPELQMVTATLKGIRCAPMVVADEKGNDVLVDTEDNLWAERLARAATVEMGCSTMTAQYMMTGREVKECLVPNSITLAHDLGRTLQESRARHADPVDAIAERLEGVRLFTGKVIDVERRTERGFARGFTQLRGIDNDEGSSITIRFQNEYLIVTRTTDDGDGSDAEVLASVPDLIICLDLETGDPITTEELRYGFRVAVIGAPCYDAWRSAEGLSLVGPRYFGYEIEYVPVRRGRITQVECATKERK